jgi:nucleoside-diphosphate-sugar epimerase
MSKILISGADGFTGRYLVALLAAAGHEVHGIAHQPVAPPVAGLVASHICDLTDAAALRDVLARIKPDKIAHLAAIAFVAHGDVDAIYRTNVVGTRNLLEAAATTGGIDAMLVASSANIYGNQVSGVIDEDVPPAPVNDYGVSKLAMEYVARLYADRLPLIVTRPFNYTGVGQNISFVVPKIVDAAARREPTIELGNLDVARDFSDVRDVVTAYAALLDSTAAIGQTFNICSGEAHSLQDVIAMIRELSGHDFEVRVNPAFVRSNEVKMLCGSRQKLDAVIGAQTLHPLRDTIEWMLADR